MAEELVLVDPVVPPPLPPTTKYKVVGLNNDMETVTPPADLPPPPEVPVMETGSVNIRVKDDTGKYTLCQYIGAEAIDLIKWMNTANFSVNSMQKRILQKLVADGKLPPGTIQGVPEKSELDI